MFATIRGMAHPPAPALIVGAADRAVLSGVVRAATSEQRAVPRARIVLRSAEGAPIERRSSMRIVAVEPTRATVELSMEELGLLMNALWQELG